VKDFAPVALAGTSTYVLSVNPALPANSVKALIALGKSRPGEFTFSSPGEGTPIHLAGEMFKAATGLDMRHVPYKSSPQAVIDVIGGQITMTFDTISTSITQLKNGKLKILAITALNRSTLLPDVPTVAESGYPGFQAVGWYGLMAPRNTPPAIVAMLNSEVVRILKLPDVRDRLLDLGIENLGSTPEEFETFAAGELARWGRLIKGANLRIE
jgi:tripartite-type tricarboxylate transporter receptor subunit TctC